MEKETKAFIIPKQDFKKYLFWAVLVFLLLFSYFILKPYLIALVSAFILAYLIRPVYSKLERKTSQSFSALISVVLVLIIVLLPLGIIGASVVKQATNYFETGNFDKLLGKISSNPILKEYNINLGNLASENSPILNFFKNFFASLPELVIALLVTLFGIFYILVYWEEIASTIKKFIPSDNKDRVLKDISEATNIIVYGTFFIGLLEFIISAVVFLALGMKFFLLLAAIIFLLAFIPAGGPSLVWVPMMAYSFLFGNYIQGAVLLIMGLVLSVGIDFFLRAKALGKRSKINPLIMLVGIFGGISVFGIFGFIIGPLVLAYTLKLVQALVKDY